MKNLVLILTIMVAAFAANAQVELKGIYLGKPTTHTAKVMSLIGEDYYIMTKSVKSGECCAIYAIPANGGKTRRVTSSEIETLCTAINNKYGVKMEFKAKSKYKDNEGNYSATKDGVQFFLHISDYNQFMDFPYEMTLMVNNVALQTLYDKEQQAKANTDL